MRFRSRCTKRLIRELGLLIADCHGAWCALSSPAEATDTLQKNPKESGEAMKQQSSVRVAVRVRPESPAKEARALARCLVPCTSNDQSEVHFHHETQTKTFT